MTQPCILITQTSPRSEALSHALIKKGFNTVISPVSTVEKLVISKTRVKHFHAIDVAIFTSVHAVSASLAYHHLLYEKTIVAVGPATENALLSHGFTDILCPKHDFDRFGVADIDIFKESNDLNIMIFANEQHATSPSLKSLLSTHGHRAYYISTHRLKIQDFDLFFSKLSPDENIDMITLSSHDGLKHLSIHAQKAPWLFQVPLCLVSKRMEKKALEYGFSGGMIYAASAHIDAVCSSISAWWQTQMDLN